MDEPKADNTVPEQLKPHLFKPGQSGNPAGRPKGARNKLSEDFFKAMASAFESNGVEAIAQMIRDRPHEFIVTIAKLQTKEHSGEGGAALFGGLNINVRD